MIYLYQLVVITTYKFMPSGCCNSTKRAPVKNVKYHLLILFFNYFYIDKCIKYTYNIIGDGGMEKNNPLYKDQGIHLITSIFTVEDGKVKILLIQRKNEPFKDMWALVGGALYNNEEIESGVKREIYEKTGIKDTEIYFANHFSRVDRSPIMRMVALSYVGIVDNKKMKVLKETFKTSNADWFTIDNIPNLAYDHNEIIKDSLEKLKELIINTDILKVLFSDEFTIPELQSVYEIILGYSLDRRNFRKKLLLDNLIVDTNKYKNYRGNKPAKLYKFR